MTSARSQIHTVIDIATKSSQTMADYISSITPQAISEVLKNYHKRSFVLHTFNHIGIILTAFLKEKSKVFDTS